jgi:feruloyl esterase
MVAGSLAIAVLGVTRPAQAESVTPPSACAALRGVSLPDATITAARAYSAGEFELPENGGSAWPPGMGPGNDAPSPMPAMCRVSLTLRPSEDSDIRMEAWLPLAGWNGKFVGVANFGTGGSIQYQSMVQPLQAGYALAANDTGHTGGGADFAVGHPQKMIDYAYRADHEMTLRARELVEKFYGRVPSRSIWVGCSLGGLQGLIEAKRYPGDYDGIVAGAPPNPLPLFNAQQLWGAWLNQRHPEGTIPAAKFAVVHQAALRACATPVGIAQGFIEDPEHCHFDPGTLLCKAGDTPDCLTASQVQRMRELYAGPLDPRTHKVMFPGPAVGAENELVMGATEPMRAAVDLYRFMVYQDPHWDWKTLDYTASVARAQREVGPLLTVDADLNAFLQRGHKLMIYVGWTEGHNGNDLVNYYREVVRAAGPAAAGNVRLFLVPGMNHCGGGAGCDTFDRVGVVDQWLQTGSAPDQILSSKESAGKVVRTRPLCAWPAIARYRGTGSMDEAASFECARPAGT